MTDSHAQLVAGVDLGGTHMQIGLVDQHNAIVSRVGLKTHAHEGSDAVLARLCAGVEDACAQAHCCVEDLVGIGVGVPSPVDATRRIALHAVNLEWRNLHVADELESRLRDTHVILENDVNVAVWGEFILGAVQGKRNILGMWMGTGIGGGLVLDGKLHHGTFGTAGEIGMARMYMRSDGREMLFEDFAARSAIEERLEEAIKAGESTTLDRNAVRDPSAVAHAFTSGDALVNQIVESAADLIGLMAANAATLLSLDAIVLGGGLVEALGDRFVHLVRSRFDEVVFPQQLRQCTIVPTQLRENAGLLGAAMLARSNAHGRTGA